MVGITFMVFITFMGDTGDTDITSDMCMRYRYHGDTHITVTPPYLYRLARASIVFSWKFPFKLTVRAVDLLLVSLLLFTFAFYISLLCFFGVIFFVSSELRSIDLFTLPVPSIILCSINLSCLLFDLFLLLVI